jgi:hypothetical protein
VAILFGVYKLGRLLGAHHAHEAFANAVGLWDVERALHLPSEENLQDWLLRLPSAVTAANVYYKFVHFPVTAAFLVWMYMRRPDHYRWARSVLAVMTGVALAVHIAVPLAPPRMLTGLGFVDTAAVYGPGVYGAVRSDGLANQFAAMPSLHVGWAMLVAVGLAVTTRSRWRWLWFAHPLITLWVVVVTANHYWLDAAVALAILAAVMLVLRPPARRHPDREGSHDVHAHPTARAHRSAPRDAVAA